MLSLSESDLKTEIDNSLTWLKGFHEKRDEMVKRYAGAHYRSEPTAAAREDRSPENYPFAYHDFVKPQLIFGTPQVHVRASRSPEDQATADALELAGNHWAVETGAKETFDQVVSDAIVGAFGVTKCGIEPRGHYAGEGLTAVEGNFDNVANYPFCVRIDPRDFIVDLEATTLKSARYIGHRFERDIDDVKTDQRYPTELTDKLVETDRQKVTRGPFGGALPREQADIRHIVTMYELYVPEHGKIITLAEGGPAGLLKLREEPYWGSDEGPYTLWGMQRVSGELIPISHLLALWDQFIELNQHRLSATDSAKKHKRIGIGSTAHEQDATVIKEAENGAFVLVGDPNSVKDFELGGVSEYQLNIVQWLRESFDKNLGFSDAQRGVSNADTATANQLAQQSSDLRIKGMRDRVKDCVTDVFRKVLWYFFNDDSIAPMELIYQDPTSGMETAATFFPGPQPNGVWHMDTYFEPQQPELDYTDFAVEIDGDSMGVKDDMIEQKRAQDEWALTQSLAGVIGPQMINWRRVIDRYGQAYNVRALSKIILVDPNVLPDPLAMMPVKGAAAGGGSSAGNGGSQPGQQQLMASPSTMPGLMNNALAGVGASVSSGPPALAGPPSAAGARRPPGR
jgi:hypothetical protein